jgi:hypothetical protein
MPLTPHEKELLEGLAVSLETEHSLSNIGETALSGTIEIASTDDGPNEE